jgi:hypothetical protein
MTWILMGKTQFFFIDYLDVLRGDHVRCNAPGNNEGIHLDLLKLEEQGVIHRGYFAYNRISPECWWWSLRKGGRFVYGDHVEWLRGEDGLCIGGRLKTPLEQIESCHIWEPPC